MNLSDLITSFIQWSQYAIETFGYLGVFLINFIGSASIILPVPAFIAMFAAGSVLNPWLVGLIGGFGGAIGELTSYLIGRGGEMAVRKSHGKWLEKAKKWFEGHAAFPIIILFAASPLPDDIVGVLCGIIKYDWRKFFIATLIGKIILTTALAWGGFYGIQWVLSVFAG